jgi:hypothetical protein
MPQRRRLAAPMLTRPPHGWVSRADVTVNLAEIETALKAGETKVSIWRALFGAGKVSPRHLSQETTLGASTPNGPDGNGSKCPEFQGRLRNRPTSNVPT